MTIQHSPLPLWTRIADVVVLVIAAAGLSVALFGGFRVVLGGIPFTAHEPLRPLGLAALILALRHVVRRSPSLGARIIAAAKAFFRAESVGSIAPLFLWSRVAVLLVATLSISTFGYQREGRSRVSEDEMANLPARWDAAWYLAIARSGYEFDPGIKGQQNVAFFPAFPMVMRAAGIFLGGHVDEPGAANANARLVALLWSGVLVNLAALAGALGYIYRMVRDFADRDVALAAVSLALAYPTAFIYNVPYTEGLFLLGSVATFYHFGRNQLAAVTLWGTLVGLTRPNGFILAGPLIAIALARSGPWPALAPWLDRLNRQPDLPTRLSRDLAVALTPVLGLLLYCAYLQAMWGDAFLWARIQVAWGRTYEGLRPALDPVGGIAQIGFNRYATLMGYELLHVLTFLLAVGVSIPIAWRLGLAYSMLIFLTLVPPLLAGGWLSMARLTATLFPVYIYLAVAMPARHRVGLIMMFALLQGLGASLFFTWRPFY